MRTLLFAYIVLLSVVACTEDTPPLDFGGTAPAPAKKKDAGGGAGADGDGGMGRKPPSSRGDAGTSVDAGGESSSSSSGSSGTSSSSGGSSSSSSSSSSSGGAGTCAGEANRDACYTCCDQKEPVGYNLYFLTFDTCICDVPATCASACGSNFCAGQNATAACETCMQNASTCWDTADLACSANSSCKPYVTCGRSCDALP
jgi:hypothetical protein